MENEETLPVFNDYPFEVSGGTYEPNSVGGWFPEDLEETQ